MNELVSVLMSVYNEPLDWVKTAIESILNQTYDNIEFVIIIDNPDRNDVIEWVQGLDDSRVIRLEVNDSNLGLIASLNKGLGICNGTYIARMDADDISLPDRIEKQMAYMKKHGVDLVGCDVSLLINGEAQNNKAFLPKTSFGVKMLIKNLGSIYHPTWLVRKKVYEELRGYRDIKYAEDYDFLVRMYINGYRFGNVKKICFCYRQNLSGISQQNKAKQKVLATIINQQIKHDRIAEVCEIESLVEKQKKYIALLEDYYHFSRMCRNFLFRTKKYKLSTILRRAKMSYVFLFCREVMQDLTRKLIVTLM